jgi:hypothetical protein
MAGDTSSSRGGGFSRDGVCALPSDWRYPRAGAKAPASEQDVPRASAASTVRLGPPSAFSSGRGNQHSRQSHLDFKSISSALRGQWDSDLGWAVDKTCSATWESDPLLHLPRLPLGSLIKTTKTSHRNSWLLDPHTPPCPTPSAPPWHPVPTPCQFSSQEAPGTRLGPENHHLKPQSPLPLWSGHSAPLKVHPYLLSSVSQPGVGRVAGGALPIKIKKL